MHLQNQITAQEHATTLSHIQQSNQFGSGYFVINDILPLKAILQSDICDWSMLMTY